MPSNYTALRQDQERLLRTINNSGRLIAGLYADRTHFIYELLQNAEDALARRPLWGGSRAVRFTLSQDSLRVTHWGKPFDNRDVEGICSIGESTKELTDIGRFGIGFKSVYAFTDRPEVHSGSEDFAIEDFVFPTAAPGLERSDDETVILLPLRAQNPHDRSAIAGGLKGLGARTLLFLRHIEEVVWDVGGRVGGLYRRSRPEVLREGVRAITVAGQEGNGPAVEQRWMLFSSPATNEDGIVVGHAEVAFQIMRDDSDRDRITRVRSSPLVAYFPTALETTLGFLVQGPYRTTPSRDNIPASDPWNQRLVQETATVLVSALGWLRDHDMLDVGALACLPLDAARFAEGSVLAPLFESTRNALLNEPLLPKFNGGHVAGRNAVLSRTQELRLLISSAQLTQLVGKGQTMHWLTAEITHDRTPELRQYILRELRISEVTPEAIIGELNKPFLEAQTDEWIASLYEFLSEQPRLHYRLDSVPIVRLEEGAHVPAHLDGEPQAFLPGEGSTEFPTVRGSVCSTRAARGFLRALGLTQASSVDDVVRNVLPKYRKPPIAVSNGEYAEDIGRILSAFATDSNEQRERLIEALRTCTWARTVDAGTHETKWATPDRTYIATDRFKKLFHGVKGVLLIDDSCSSLRGEQIREVLESCGALRHLRPVPDSSLTADERRSLREKVGHPKTSRQNDHVSDTSLVGLKELLELLSRLPSEEHAMRAGLLWEELVHLEERGGKALFEGQYTWTHNGSYRALFDSSFVRLLNTTRWVPDAKGDPEFPQFMLFDSLAWRSNPFLQSKIRFKAPLIERLAEEAGIDPAVIDLLKRLGLTNADKLRARLNIENESPLPGTTVDDLGDPDSEGKEPLAGQDALQPEANGELGQSAPEPDGSPDDVTRPARERQKSDRGHADAERPSNGSQARERRVTSDSLFISYIGAHPGEGPEDPDSLDYAKRMALEQQAIRLILENEPTLQATPTHNPGFDLVEEGAGGQPIRWVEVKAMTGTLKDRPVGMSWKQFETALSCGANYWLYIVEHAGSPDQARVIRIQDPAGRTSTLTFDHGWMSAAEGL